MPAPPKLDGLLVDLDGCVWLGPELIPGAIEALRALREAGTPIVFVTNDARTAPADHVRRLRDAGLGVADDGVVTSASVTADLAAEAAPGSTAVVIGTEPFREAVRAAGLSIAEDGDGGEASVVIVGGDQRFGYAQLRDAVTAGLAGAPVFAANRDPTLPMPDGMWPGTGAVVAAIEYATGAEATVAGKPSPHLFQEALRRLGRPERAAMVGDRLDSDMAGARGAGLETILVLSGATSTEDADRAEPRPDHVIESLAGIGAVLSD